MKKKIFAVAVIAICLSILASATLAYYTAEDTAHNVITTDQITVIIEEWQEGEDGKWIAYPSEPITVLPATQVSKIVTVKNVHADSFVRAKYDIVLRKNGEVVDYPTDVITITVNDTEWQRKSGDSSWWYYSASLEAGETTAPLITAVVFDGPGMTDEYQNCTVEVIVTAQAVQTVHNGNTALEALGWPEP